MELEKVLAPQLEYSAEDARMVAVGKEVAADDDYEKEAPEGKDWVGDEMAVAGLLVVGAEAWGHSPGREETLSLVLEAAISMVQSDGASAEDEDAVETDAGSASPVVDVDGAGNQGSGVEIAAETVAVVGNAAVGEGVAGTGAVAEGVGVGEEADGRAVPAAATAPAWVGMSVSVHCLVVVAGA